MAVSRQGTVYVMLKRYEFIGSRGRGVGEVTEGFLEEVDCTEPHLEGYLRVREAERRKDVFGSVCIRGSEQEF